MLGLLEKVTLDPDHVSPDDIRPLFALGVSKQAIEDALRICACFHIIARLADAFAVEIPNAEGFRQTGMQLLAHGYA